MIGALVIFAVFIFGLCYAFAYDTSTYMHSTHGSPKGICHIFHRSWHHRNVIDDGADVGFGCNLDHVVCYKCGREWDEWSMVM